MEKLTEQPIKKKIRNYITLNSVSKDEIRQEYNEIYDKLKEYEDKQEWISVEERLPVIQGKYLVYTYDRRMFMCDLIDHYCNGDLQFDDYRVTHWMPLPQPPQMKGAE